MFISSFYIINLRFLDSKPQIHKIISLAYYRIETIDAMVLTKFNKTEN